MPHASTRRRRILSIATILAVILCVLPATALALTNGQIDAAVNNVVSNGSAKWVSVYNRSGSGSGFFSANICTSTVNSSNATYFFPYTMVVNYALNSYTTNNTGGAYVRMGNATSNGARC